MNNYEVSSRRNILLSEVQRLRRIIMIMTILLAACLVISFFCVKNYSTQAVKALSMETEYGELSAEYSTLYTTYEGIYNEYIEALNYNTDCENQITYLYEQLVEMQEQNEALVASNNEYYAQIQEYEKRSELYDKYEYAIIRTNGTRTDITYDQLATVEELSTTEGVDTDLILSIVMVESNGTEVIDNSSSTARGYGQFLASTASYVYENLLNAGSYTHEYAYDGDTNLSMLVAYLDYLSGIHDNNLYSMLRNYSGSSGSVLANYINKLDNYLETKGKSISSIASDMLS